MKLWQKWLLASFGFLLIVAAFIAFALPGIIRGKAQAMVRASTGRTLSIGKISLNPFTWKAQARGIRLTERDQVTTFASFSSVTVTVSPKSIFAAAPVITEAQVVSPYFHLVRSAANSYNFSDLLTEKKKKEKNTPPPEFSLNNITVANGSVDFIDRALPEEKRHTMREIGIGVPFVSTIPHLADRYVQPYFKAVINGAPVDFAGKLKPFAKAAEYSLSLDLKEVDIPFYLAYLPTKPPVVVRRGTAGAHLVLTCRNAALKNPEIQVDGALRIRGLDVKEPGGAPLLTLADFQAAGMRALLVAARYSVSTLSFDGLKLQVTRDRKGEWNFSRLSGGEEKEKKGVEAEEKKDVNHAPLVEAGRITVKNGMVSLDDLQPQGGYHGALEKIALDIEGLSTKEGKKAKIDFSCTAPPAGAATVQGELAPDPLLVSSTIEVKGVALKPFYPYLAGVLTAPVQGTAAFSANIDFAKEPGLSVDKLKLVLRDLSASLGGAEGVSLKSLELLRGRYQSRENRLDIDTIALSGGKARFKRGEDGRLSPLKLLREGRKGEKGATGKKAPAPVKEGKPFSYRIAKISASGLDLAVTDRTVEDHPTFAVRRVAFTLQGLAGPVTPPLSYRLSARLNDDGEVASSGTVKLTPLAIKGETSLKEIDLTDFTPYLPPGVNLVLADGALNTSLTYTLHKKGDVLLGTFRGSAGVHTFHALDVEGEDLLKWERLEFEDMTGTVAPFTIKIEDISLAKYYARIVIDDDGRLNLQKLYTPKNAQTVTPPPHAAPPAARAQGPHAIDVKTVTLSEGTLNFTDRHMQGREYSTTMYNLGGRVSGLTSEASKYAEVDLRGNLENHSPLLITGRVNPLAGDLYADLTARFTDIELTPLTPYSGTYIGYGLNRGKLSLDLRYKIENRQLNSENKVFVDQLTFGKKIESDKATNLPVRLAVALLKDRKGEIHLDLPVTGRTDDPKFSVWGVLWKMIKNILVKAATAPFALLQSTFGGGENFSVVPFAAGSAHLTREEEGKLLKLAQLLKERPSLKIDIKGYLDKERDPEAYRSETILRKMKAEKFLELVKEKKNRPGDSIETMTMTPEESKSYLTQVYKKEKFPKPRNVLGLVKELPEDEMRKLLKAHTVVGPTELKALADERAGVVRTFLAGAGGVDPARLFQKDDDPHKPPTEGGAPSRVEFGVTVD